MPPETYEYKQFSRRTLPHIHSPGATLFVTFRLHRSIPKVVLRQWEHERSDLLKTISVLCNSDINEAIDLALSERVRVFNRQWFAKYEEVLHAASSGPNWLKDAPIAQVVANAFHHLDEQAYGLHAYSIMSNHAHVAFTP